jgi:hypothetical protein
LIFLGIDKGTDQAIYLQKRSYCLQSKNKSSDLGRETNFNNQLSMPFEENGSEGSYALESSYLSCDKKSQIQEPLLANEEYNEKFNLKKTTSNAEFSAEIKEWQKSNEGNYIEYVIEFAYVGGKSWMLSKRYSDFLYVHSKILNSSEKDIPDLPPKIENRSPEQLDLRIRQLQQYLDQHLLRTPISQYILEFCELEGHGSQLFREISRKHIKNIELAVEDKQYKLTETGNVDTFFKVAIRIHSEEDDARMQVSNQFTYDTLQSFHTELKLIARMGDVDITCVGEFPSRTKEDGQKYLDQQLMISIEEYLRSFKDSSSILNLIIFKKLISDNIITELAEEEVDMLISKKKNRLFGSIRNDTDIFSGKLRCV